MGWRGLTSCTLSAAVLLAGSCAGLSAGDTAVPFTAPCEGLLTGFNADRFAGLIAVPFAAEEEGEVRYVIVTDAGAGAKADPFEKVVEELARFRKAACILRIEGEDLAPVFSRLKKEQPEFVAFVVRPERLEANLAGAVFQGMAALDDDPFLDVPYGFITGATVKDALALVENTKQAESHPEGIPRRFAAVAHTFAANDLGPFAAEQAEYFSAYGFETAGINPRDDSPEWKRMAARELKKLNGASLVFFAGHGMGDLSCAIPGRDLGKARLEAAVVVNGTCHSAVTCLRYDSADRFWRMKKTAMNPAESVCLNLIRAGAVGQFASTAGSSWPNVASTINHFFKGGLTLGEALQGSLNQKILAAGVKSVEILPFEEGEPSPQSLGDDRNPGGIQSIARVVLVGDPAYRPYPWRKDDDLQRLVYELSRSKPGDFTALNEIIAKGREAVPALLLELKGGGNWQVPKALGAIADPRAIEPLIEKLEKTDRQPMSGVIAEALERITGQRLGTDAGAWRSWWEKERGRRTKQADEETRNRYTKPSPETPCRQNSRVATGSCISGEHVRKRTPASPRPCADTYHPSLVPTWRPVKVDVSAPHLTSPARGSTRPRPRRPPGRGTW